MDKIVRGILVICLISLIFNLFFISSTLYSPENITINLNPDQYQELFSFSSSAGENPSNDESFQTNPSQNASSSNNLEKEECIVHHSDFSPEEYQSIFKYQKYYRCVSTKDYSISQNDDKEVIIQCKDKKNPLYFSEDIPQMYGGEKKLIVRWTKVKTLSENSEFLLFKCSNKNIQALVFNRFKEEASIRANLIREKLSPKKKNMNVLLITLDSVSKNSFRINLPRTFEFLNLIEKDFQNFKSFRFSKSAVPEAFTRANMAEILFGKKEIELKKAKKFKLGSHVFVTKGRDKNQDHAIWTHFKNLGYVTMFLHDTVWDYLPHFTGRIIDADNVFTNIWRYLWYLTDKHDFSEDQRCIGKKNFHELSFEYTLQFFSNYKENNKFGYLHLDAGHEGTGNIKTVDKDLYHFLRDLLTLVKSRDESLALFLISDHGFKYLNRIQFDARSFFEPKVAQTNLILSQDIIKDWKVDNFISKNLNKLNGRFDLNLSLKELAYFPYNQNYNLSDLKTYKDYKVYSLLTEYLPNNRTCSEIGVPQINCICNWFEPVDLQLKHEIVVRDYLFDLVRRYFVESRNQTIDCDPLMDYDVLKYESFQLKSMDEGFDTLYQVEIKIPKSVIKAKANFCTEKKILSTQKILEGGEFPFTFFEILGELVFLQISALEVDERCIENVCGCLDYDNL